MATQTSSETPRSLGEPVTLDAAMTNAPKSTSSDEPAVKQRPRSDMDDVLGLNRRLQ